MQAFSQAVKFALAHEAMVASAHDSICEQSSLYLFSRPYVRIFQSTCGPSRFLRHPKKFQSGGLVRARPPLCISLRGAMVHHTHRNFPKRARGVIIFEASKKIPKRGARSGSLPALHRLAGAMVHHASRHFPKHVRAVSIFAPSRKIPKRWARSVSRVHFA